jgi:hypothetical protein
MAACWATSPCVAATLPAAASDGDVAFAAAALDAGPGSTSPVETATGTGQQQCFYTVPPCRLLDTREPAGAGRVTDGTRRTLRAVGNCGLSEGWQSVAINLTAIRPSGDAEIALGSAAEAPAAPVLVLGGGQTRAVNAVVQLGDATDLALDAAVSGGGDTDLVVDVTGFFSGEPPVADAGHFAGDEGIACLLVTLRGTSLNPDLVFYVTSLPTHGDLYDAPPDPTLPANESRLCYEPKSRFFSGTDSFTYKVYDGCLRALSPDATVTLVVNDVN